MKQRILSVLCLLYFGSSLPNHISWAQSNVLTVAKQIKIQVNVREDIELSSSTEFDAFLFDQDYRNCTKESGIAVTTNPGERSTLTITAKIAPDRLYYAVVLARQNADWPHLRPILNLTVDLASMQETTDVYALGMLGKELHVAEVQLAGAIMENSALNNTTESEALAQLRDEINQADNDRSFIRDAGEIEVSNRSTRRAIVSVSLRCSYIDVAGRLQLLLPLDAYPYYVFDERLDRDVTYGVSLGRSDSKNPQVAVTDDVGRAKLRLKTDRTYSLITNSLDGGFTPVEVWLSVKKDSTLSITANKISQLPDNHRQALLNRLIARIGSVVYPDENRNPPDSVKISKIDGPNAEYKLQRWETLQIFLAQLENLASDPSIDFAELGEANSPIDLLVPLYQSTPNTDWSKLLRAVNSKTINSSVMWCIVNPNSGPYLNRWKDSYGAAILSARQSRCFNLLGYVSVIANNGRQKDFNEILAECQHYSDSCQGVFIDNCTLSSNSEIFANLYSSIRQNATTQEFTVFVCPGSELSPAVVQQVQDGVKIADFFCTSNSTTPNYDFIQGFNDRMARQPVIPPPGLGVIHRGANLETAQLSLNEAVRSGARFVCITNLDGDLATQRLPDQRLLDLVFRNLEHHNRAANTWKQQLSLFPPRN